MSRFKVSVVTEPDRSKLEIPVEAQSTSAPSTQTSQQVFQHVAHAQTQQPPMVYHQGQQMQVQGHPQLAAGLGQVATHVIAQAQPQGPQQSEDITSVINHSFEKLLEAATSYPKKGN